MCELVAKYDAKTVKDVPAELFIKAFAAHLKAQGQMEVPKWAEYIKTGTQRELAPYDDDYLYIRAAAIARRIYIRPNIGVGALRKIFGMKSNSGTCRTHFTLGAGKINRFLLQQLEKMGFIAQSDAMKGGRIITSLGRQTLDTVAVQAAKAAKPAVEEEEEAQPAEEEVAQE
ncbi:40S ribosomal protein S19, putative [Perkinsus marinus ATCC 50983]|uniref:40S ribosomal protein S19, putative n=1 Tax=Perkinsus marinus (strain ATCC 50983 / TXsc) TaxID=423536 RepID=C5L7M6_PERM5|nr:40S ribosomal protein S19, putative [Perkinsus marinus ATCC 50983]XP_002775672.1 40S ribosomal protein S19, putative [Perkinsus marinus ATCC 50983]EER04288.1 40S ribosomal protein S19, putative [Perkinsus marinus ATCC 50983]EER07488.1 40S ribosomal protein S19, putative [Perkinsus marinus ATCC 50983]|eukprot:XP_002772472.1 40S ribosomal protein S19, putative [Perkinsus marinus ATCC 50983]